MSFNRKYRRAQKSSDPDERFAIDMRTAQDREVERRKALHLSNGESPSLAITHAVFEVAVSSVICALGLMRLYGARDQDSQLMLKEAKSIFDEVHPMVTKLAVNEKTQETGKS